MNPGDMERGEFITQLEDAIQQAAQRMDKAQRKDDMARFHMAAEVWRQAQILWLQAAQSISAEKAQAVMICFAAGGELAKWLDEKRPGPPPSVLVLYKDKPDA
jgi:hypothetical protein